MDNSRELSNLCQNIAKLRKAHRLTRKQMAEIMGISTKSLEKIESGILPLRFGCNALVRLRNAFSIPVSLLFSGDFLGNL